MSRFPSLGGLGGASYVYIASYDEAVGTPTEETVRVAIRTQQIIAEEHGFTDTIDPLGGSYFVEALTLKTARKMLEHLQRIEDHGGALRVIDSGFGREVMNRGAQRKQQRLDRGERPWVTVNKWPQRPNVPTQRSGWTHQPPPDNMSGPREFARHVTMLVSSAHWSPSAKLVSPART